MQRNRKSQPMWSIWSVHRTDHMYVPWPPLKTPQNNGKWIFLNHDATRTKKIGEHTTTTKI